MNLDADINANDGDWDIAVGCSGDTEGDCGNAYTQVVWIHDNQLSYVRYFWEWNTNTTATASAGYTVNSCNSSICTTFWGTPAVGDTYYDYVHNGEFTPYVNGTIAPNNGTTGIGPELPFVIGSNTQTADAQLVGEVNSPCSNLPGISTDKATGHYWQCYDNGWIAASQSQSSVLSFGNYSWAYAGWYSNGSDQGVQVWTDPPTHGC